MSYDSDNKRFSRNRIHEREEMRDELRRLGITPMPEPPPNPLPPATTRASRPDLKPAFDQGVASAKRIAHPNVYAEAGDNIGDTNVFPDARVAENGVPRADRGLDPHGRAARKRPGEP